MRMLVASVLAAMTLILGAGTARALCSGNSYAASSLREGHVAFVGTVGSLRNGDLWATFQVDEVWSSDELPRFVEVRGGRGQEAFFEIFSNVGSTDRQFADGVTYLVFPTIEGGTLFDDSCSATQEWSSELAALRPATAHPPVDGLALAGVPWAHVTIGLATSVVAGVGAGLFWRRRSSER